MFFYHIFNIYKNVNYTPLQKNFIDNKFSVRLKIGIN